MILFGVCANCIDHETRMTRLLLSLAHRSENSMYRYSLRCSLWIAVSSFLLALRPVHADFGTGTITFDDASYTVYDWANVQTWAADPYDAVTNPGGVLESSISSSTLSVSDDQVIGLDQAFRVTTSNGNVYVRFGFDESVRNTGGTVGSLDSGDTPAVIEATYAGTSAESSSPLGDVMAYTSVGRADFIESGYETQAGAFFVRARKDNNGNGTETNDAGDEEKWSSFIIDYAGAAVTEATGEIWDIDSNSSQGAEKFRVTATGNSASVTDGSYSVTEDSPTGLLESDSNGLDAKPWQFAFGSADGFTDIDQIKITRFEDSGSVYKDYFPLAFNNFNPVSSIGYFTPEPSSLLAFGGILSLAVLRRRRRSGASE